MKGKGSVVRKSSRCKIPSAVRGLPKPLRRRVLREPDLTKVSVMKPNNRDPLVYVGDRVVGAWLDIKGFRYIGLPYFSPSHYGVYIRWDGEDRTTLDKEDVDFTAFDRAIHGDRPVFTYCYPRTLLRVSYMRLMVKA